MVQATRAAADYATALTTAVEEEIAGAAFFDALANQHDGEARRALRLMAEIERALVAAVQPAVRGNGLLLRDAETLHAEGRDEAGAMRGTSWTAFLDQVIADYPAFLDEFRQLARLAPAQDRDVAQLLIDHEAAFIDFALACRRGEADSLDILAAFLGRVGPGAARPADRA